MRTVLLGLICAIVGAGTAVAQAPARADREAQKRALILYTLRRELPFTGILERVYQKTLSDGLAGGLDYYAEYIDVARFPEPGYQEALRDFLRRKYADQRFDLIVASGNATFEFVARHELFPGSPVVFSGYGDLRPIPNSTGLIFTVDMKSTLDLALRLQPEIKRVFVVCGVSGFEKYFENTARRQFQDYDGRIEFTYLTGLSLADIQGAVAKTPEDSIIYFISLVEDGAGNKFIPLDALDKISSVANAPIYSWYDVPIDHGIVGGSLISTELVARQTAELALRALRGENPDRIPVAEVRPNINIFDWRQLRRWGISEDRLPPGSVIRFREPSFWEHYKWWIIGVVSLCMVEGLLIFALLAQRAWRRRVEESLRDNEERLKLALSASNMGAWDWRMGADDLKWSGEMRQIFGLTNGKSAVTTELFFDLIHPDDRPAVSRAITRTINEGAPYDVEFRIVHQDGSMHWVMGKGKALMDEAGQAARMLGVNMDITARKQAEDALRRSEARYRAIVEDQTELICRLLPDGRYTYVNDAYCRYFGRSQEELIGRAFLPFIPAEEEERVNQFLASISPGHPVGTMEHRVILPDGGMRWHQWTDRGIFDEQGKLLELQCVGRDITQSKQAEEALRQSEYKFSKAFRSSPDAFAISRQADGMILEVNDRWEEILGYARDEAVGRTVWELQIYLNPGDRERLVSLVRDLGSARDFEVDLRKRSGEIRNVLVSAEPIMIRGEPCMMLIVRDITRRKQMERALSQSQRRYTLAAAAGRVGLWDWNIETNDIYVDPELKALLGYQDDEIRNHLDDWGSQVHPDDAEDVMAAAQAHIEGRAPSFEVEHRMIRKDGAICWFLARGTLIEGENGVRHIIGTDTDITERKRAEEALRESEERLRVALEAGRMGVWEWDTKTNAVKWSKEHYTVMGMTPFGVEPDYHAWADRVCPDDLPVAMGAISKAIEEKREYRCEYRIIWSDGNVRWVEGRGKPVYDEAGQCLKVGGLIVDITERKQAEQSLRESEEALRKSYARIEDLAGRLIAAQEEERRHIARELHDDLNQQVAALAIGISRLKRQFPDAGAAVQEQIAKLREKTDWLSERIRQVSHELHSSILQHVGLPAALNSYCAEFSDREGIAVTLDIRDGVEAVSPDAALCLYRVAQESLRNIARHSGAQSATVALVRVNGAIELRVADHGVGFDPGQAREGRGLGLVSMEERVKLLHGDFVLTTQPGAGTELRAQIPLRGAHEQNKGLAG
jgi:PAS domain S-box-containing protein